LSDPLLDFGRVVRRARRDRELSQEALARASGLGAKHISEIERGNKDPRLTTVLQLAHALGLSAGDLFAASAREFVSGSDTHP
jgi:transcriptional regulator with XRE-family HTH domain